MTRTFVCSSCGMMDFDALLDFRFKNSLCCDYVIVEERQVLGDQTVLFHRGARPSLGIRHWTWHVGGWM